MELLFNNKNNKEYQVLLNNLLKDIFLDFSFWYDLDLWNDQYESYSFMDKGEIVSNICLFKTEVLFEGEKYPALSVGAVATREDYRGMGLSRKLMEHIIQKYPNTPMYLSANEDVVNFYPRFGFERIYEKLPTASCTIDNNITPVKVHYQDKLILDYIYNRVNFSQTLDCMGSESINIFHIYLGYLHEHIYHISDIDTLVIGEQDGKSLKLYGVFSLKPITFEDLKHNLPFKGIRTIEFGFMPPWEDIDFTMNDYETDPIFVRGVTKNLGDFKFPELSTT